MDPATENPFCRSCTRAGTYRAVAGYDVQGTLVSSSVTAACSNACDSNPLCTYYVQDGSTCYLRSQPLLGNGTQSGTTGAKTSVTEIGFKTIDPTPCVSTCGEVRAESLSAISRTYDQ